MKDEEKKKKLYDRRSEDIIMTKSKLLMIYVKILDVLSKGNEEIKRF